MSKNIMQVLAEANAEIARLKALVSQLTTSLNDTVGNSHNTLDILEMLVNYHDKQDPISVVMALDALSKHRKASLSSEVH